MGGATTGKQVEPERLYVVDRLEGDFAVLVADDEALPDEDVASGAFPARPSEGDVLRVPLRGGLPVWEEAVADSELRAARMDAARRRLERLSKRDPGGDVVL